MTRKLSVYALVLALGLAVFGPSMVAWGAINYPSVFGQLTGDCGTPSAGSYTTTCTKLNGVPPGSAFSQNTGTSGATIPLLSGTNTWSNPQTFAAISTAGINASGAFSGTTASLSGALTGAGNTFSGLSTQTGGHVVGTGDFTGSGTLTAAQEDVQFTCTAACTGTLPASPVNGQTVNIADSSATAGLLTIAANGSGIKVLTPTGAATTLAFTVLYQGVKLVYHSSNTTWIAE